MELRYRVVDLPDTVEAGSWKPVDEKFKKRYVFSGRIICQICYEGCKTHHIKRNKFETISDHNNFKNIAFEWISKDHVYNHVYNHKILWSDLGKIRAHKNCKSMFMKRAFLDRLPDLPAQSGELNETENMPIGDPAGDDELDHCGKVNVKNTLIYQDGWRKRGNRA